MTDLQSRLSKKLSASISEILVKGKTAEGGCISLVNDLETLIQDEKYIDESLMDTLQSLMNSSAFSSECKDSIIKKIEEVPAVNFESSVLKVHELIFQNRIEDAFSLIEKDSRFEGNEKTINILKYIALRSGQYKECALIMAKLGLLVPEILHSFLESKPDIQEIKKIVLLMKEHSKATDYTTFLETVYAGHALGEFRNELISLYLKSANKEKLSQLMKGISESSISDADELSRLSDIFLSGGDMEMAMRFSKKAIVLDPTLLEANLSYLKALTSSERYEEAYSQAQKIGSESLRNDRIAMLKVISAYRTNRFRECIETVEELQKTGNSSRELLLYLIRSYIGLSDYHRALKIIEENDAAYATDSEILKEKFKLEQMFENKGQIYLTAEKILLIENNNQDALRFVILRLYESEEYSKIVERFSSITSDDPEILALVISSYLRTSTDIEGIKSVLRKSGPVLLEARFIDTIFEIATTDAFISMLAQEIPLASEPAWGIMTILDFLTGKTLSANKNDLDKAVKLKSVGLTWSLAKSRFYASDCVIEEEIYSILSGKPSDVILSTLTRLKEIFEGKSPKNVRDSPFMKYPVSEALALTNKNKEAETTLEESVRDKKTDPFYWYVTALTQYVASDFASSMKSIKRALQSFTNVDFLILKLKDAIKQEDKEEFKNTLEKLFTLQETGKIPFSQIREFVSGTGVDLLSWVAQILERNTLDDEEASRIILMQKERMGDLSNASKVSRRIMSGKYMKSDLLKHISLLEKMNNSEDRIKILKEAETKFKDPQIETMLAESLYEERNYQEAYDHFLHAIDLGADISSNRAFAETLLETKKYKDANELIDKNSFFALKIRYLARQHSYKELIEIFLEIKPDTYEWNESLDFITGNLWKNSDIREMLFKFFDKSRNRSLGEQIANVLSTAGDKVEAIEIRRKLVKAYPEDAFNISKLAILQAEGGYVADSIALLKKSIGKLKRPEAGLEIIDTLIRISYLNGYFDDVIQVYEANPTYINHNNIEMIIRSYIEKRDYATAEKIASRYNGAILADTAFDEIIKEINESRHFFSIADLTAQLLDAEYKAGRIFDLEEAVYKAGIPVAKAEEIFQFLSEEGYYADINRPKYEAISKEIMQKAVRKASLSNIGQLRINVIFNCMDNRDLILAKNIYIYIKENLNKQRYADADNSYKEKLVKAALRERLRIEPLNIAYNLNLGIDDAMDVIVLLNHILDLSRGGGR